MNYYLIIGIIVSLFTIWVFRRDGTTKKPFELYLAVIAPLLWPAVLVLMVIDLRRKSKRTKYPMNSLWPVGKFVKLSNLPCIVDVEFEGDAVKSIYNVYHLDFTKIQNMSPDELNDVHEELNRGKYEELAKPWISQGLYPPPLPN